MVIYWPGCKQDSAQDRAPWVRQGTAFGARHRGARHALRIPLTLLAGVATWKRHAEPLRGQVLSTLTLCAESLSDIGTMRRFGIGASVTFHKATSYAFYMAYSLSVSSAWAMFMASQVELADNGSSHACCILICRRGHGGSWVIHGSPTASTLVVHTEAFYFRVKR